MNNIMLKLKRFLGNKNTVTIFGVIAGVIVLLVGYNYRVNQAVQPIEIPFATVRMEPKSKVEANNVGKIKVSGAFTQQIPDLVTSKDYIIRSEWYVNYDTVIPAGGLFYKSQLIPKDKLPDTAFDDIENGATVFSLSVDSHSTYGNSIMPGNFIDLYIKATDDAGKVIFGKFIESIEVLSVRDTAGNEVFSDSTVKRNSGELLFAVKDDLFLILSEASFVGGIEIIPVPRNAAYRDNGNTINPEENGGDTGEQNTTTGTQVSREELVAFILEKVSELSDPIDLENVVKPSDDHSGTEY